MQLSKHAIIEEYPTLPTRKLLLGGLPLAAAPLAFPVDQFAFAASHSSAVHFSTSASVEDVKVAAVIVGEFDAGGEDDVCAIAPPALTSPAITAAEKPARI
jgi:hypothetical protein